MPNETSVYFPGKTKLYFPKKQVLPRAGEVTLECGDCGTVGQFRPHVLIDAEKGSARITELICNCCLKTYPLDEDGYFVRGGRFNMRGKVG